MYTISCRGAGIGIQDSLKNYCPHGLKGSSPFPGKILKPPEKVVFLWLVFWLGKRRSMRIFQRNMTVEKNSPHPFQSAFFDSVRH